MARQPIVRGDLYDSRLATNLRRLIQHQANGSVNAWVSSRPPLQQTTINRIQNGTRDATVSMLHDIEEATGYAPWQLLHPEFDPVKMPPMMDKRAMRVAAIFASIRDDTDKRRAEAIMEQFADDQAPSEAAPTRAPAQAAKTPSA